MASVREYVSLYLQKQAKTAGSIIGGGNAILETAQHALDGPEHTDPSDQTRLDVSDSAHGLHPKLTGDHADVLHGDGSQEPIDALELVTSETDTGKALGPDGLGGVVWSTIAGAKYHPVMAQDPGGTEPTRWWVVVDGDGTAVIAAE